MRVNFSHIILVLSFLQLHSTTAQESNPTQEIRFKTNNGFFGIATIQYKSYYKDSFKLDLSLSSIKIEGFETSLGVFTKNKLASYGVVFPLECHDCSSALKGSISVLLPDSYSRTYIDFNTDEGLSKNSITTLTIPLSSSNIADSHLINAWLNTASIERAEITRVEGSTLRSIINATRQFASNKEDNDVLSVLINELKQTPANEQRQLVYNSRNRFADKTKADSLMKVIESGNFASPKVANTPTKLAPKSDPKPTVSKEQNSYKQPNNSTENAHLVNAAEESRYLIEELKQRLVSEKNRCSEELLELENKKDEAVKNEDYLVANELNKTLTSLKKDCIDNLLSFEVEIAQAEKELAAQKKNNSGQKEALEKCTKEIQDLELMKSSAIKKEDYLAAAELKKAILEQKEKCQVIGATSTSFRDASVAIPLNIRQEKEPQQKIASSQNPLVAVVSQTTTKKNTPSSKSDPKDNSLGALIGNSAIATEQHSSDGLEEILPQDSRKASLSEILAVSDQGSLATIMEKQNTNQNNNGKLKKVSKSNFEFTTDLKSYKRSSLATIMLENETEEHIATIKNTFLEKPLPDKFNIHRINDRFIPIQFTAKNHSRSISQYLAANQVAKKLVAKWFNRDENGSFNMDLIAERGHYNASAFDVNIARNSERGLAMLADAGEQLIGNTFVVVNDYKFTNKEEVGQKVSLLANLTSIAASYSGAGDVATVANAVSLGSAVAGKGYVIKTTSYLYKLVWTPKIAETFYNDHWMDNNSFDPSKKAAFENSNLFRLVLLGYENAWADVQSSIFTNKSEEELIERATIKATDQAIAKLQRKFEIFRTKTPLISTEPLAAKIGLKEGVEKGDKFEVLEQYLKDNGTVGFKRKGVIKVDKGAIWDNRYMAHEENPSYLDHTQFKGDTKRLYPGMLIRQIN